MYRRWISVQNGWIRGHSHQMCNRDPRAALHLQEVKGTVGWNLWILSGVLYHLENILYRFSWVNINGAFMNMAENAFPFSCCQIYGKLRFPLSGGLIFFSFVC